MYEKQTEKSEWLGVQEAPKDYVMDVVLKREYRKGYLANLQAGGGTEGRYVGKAFGQRYTDHSSLNIFFNGNNINEQENPDNKGDWSSSKAQRDGTFNMKKGGVNLSINDKDKRWTEQMNMEVVGLRQHKEEHTSTEHFLSKGNEFSRNVSNQHYRDFQMGGSNTFTLRKPFWFRNIIGIYYGHNTSHGYQRYGRFTKDPSWIGGPQIVLDSAFHYSPELMNVLVNMRNNDDTGSETNWFAEYKPNLSYKFIWGDDIDLWGRFLYENHRQKENEQVLTEGYSSDQRNKQLVYDNKYLNWEAGVQYTIHSHSHWNYRAAVGYYYKRNKEENERYLSPFPGGKATGERALPGMGERGGLDLRNSYTYTFTSKRVTPMAMIYYQRDNQKKHRSTWLSFSVPLHIEKQQIAYRSDTTFARHIVLPTPEIRYECSYNQGLNFLYFTYNTEYFTPTMLNMVNTFFDYDPLNIQMGNGNLKKSHTINTLTSKVIGIHGGN